MLVSTLVLMLVGREQTMQQGVLLEPEGLYDDGSLYNLIGLSDATLARARREGLLRYTKQGHKIFYLGKWLIEWLQTDSQGPRGAVVQEVAKVG
jgi:hypothetical protein